MITIDESLRCVIRDVSECREEVANRTQHLTGRMGVGLHAFRLACDRLTEAQALFEAAAGLEAANKPSPK